MADVLNPPSGTSRRVAVPKYEPGVHPRYASGQSTVLGWVQVAAGAAVIVAAITARATYTNNLVIGDIFTGILMTLTGAFGVAAGKYKTTGPIVSLMVLAIVSSTAALIAFFVWVVEVDEVKTNHPHDVAVATVTGYIFVFAYFFDAIASIWSAIIACNVTCCGYRHPGIGIATTGYLHPRGNVTVMFAHSSQSSSSLLPTRVLTCRMDASSRHRPLHTA
ncbi:hypothetical protein NP493_73g05069 [Ridgeia piscesae]|uniref:Uncharacterized protein n=1 Tax=Ridgeia piscesae TaxID=27915 RepID=A0AAD9P9I1_RIDPI|nr:hypothetical protein NP493_73g05069 [Ridgeia piscesae]